MADEYFIETETQIVCSCISMLNLMGIYAWRNNTGALKDAKGRMIHFGKVGSADILGITKEGKFVAVECKKPRGKVTIFQQQFLDEVKKRGGIAMVVHSVDEMIDKFDELDGGQRYESYGD